MAHCLWEVEFVLETLRTSDFLKKFQTDVTSISSKWKSSHSFWIILQLPSEFNFKLDFGYEIFAVMSLLYLRKRYIKYLASLLSQRKL